MTVNIYRRGEVWWARIPNPAGGDGERRSLGTRSESDARRARDFVLWLWHEGGDASWLLAELCAGRIDVWKAFMAYRANDLNKFIRDAKAAESDPDIEPYVVEWVKELTRRGKPNEKERAKYMRQVRTLIPAGRRFPRSELNKSRIRKWLWSTDVTAPNRYRAALSSFCRFLVEDVDVLETNPVHAVRGSKEPAPRERWITPAEAKTLCEAMPAPYGAFHAMLIVFGLDVQTSGLKVTHADIDRMAGTLHTRGTKAVRRDRTCIVFEPWRELWRLVERHLLANPGTPRGKVFPTVTYWGQMRELRSAAKAIGLDDYTTKDHRHTFGVALAKADYSTQKIAHQLGNDEAVTARVYAKYQPDHDTKATRNNTKSVTQ